MEQARRISYKDIAKVGFAGRKGFKGVTTALEGLASKNHLNRIVVDVPLVAPVVFINHPTDVEAVWRTHQADLDKQGSLYDGMREMFGNGHVLSRRDTSWSALKRITTPPLRPTNIPELPSRSTEILDDTLDYFLLKSNSGEKKEELSGEVNVHKALKVASAKLSTKILFGVEIPLDEVENLTDEITFLNDYVTRHAGALKLAERVRKNIPGAFKHVSAAYDLLNNAVDNILDNGDSRLMTALRDHGPDGDGVITRDDQRGEIINTLVASYGNIANAIAWSSYFLSLPGNQELQQKIIDEERVGKDPQDLDATSRKVFSEALRLYSPVYLVTRKATDDIDVSSANGDMHIPKGSKVVFSPYLLHRNPQVWDKPQEFLPERFNTPPAKNTYLPFGYGDRACTGIQFSYQVGSEVLQHLVTNYEFSIADSADPVPVFLTNLSPKDVKMNVTKRN